MNAHAPSPRAERVPEPERWEPQLDDPRLRDFTPRDWVAIARRSVSETLADNMPMVASAVAYSSFFAIPSILLLTVGLFTLIASPQGITDLMDRFGTFMPEEATTLLEESLRRLEEQPASGLVLTLLGLALAVWATTSAMTTYMVALNLAYNREDGRGFVRKRAVALAMVVAIGSAVLLVGLLLIFGPFVQRFVGDVLGVEGVLSWLWWTVQWPVLAAGLLAAFAVLQYFGPDVEHPRWQFITPGAIVAVVGWIVASSGFAIYASLFGSYNKAWGSFAAVIVTLTWLWLSALALLFGGEVNAEVERTRAHRQGKTPDAPRRSDTPD